MKYAINLYDLMTLQKKDPVGALLFPPDILGLTVNANKRKVGEDALVLRCDEARAAAVVKLLRGEREKYQVRLYKSKTGNGGWKRI